MVRFTSAPTKFDSAPFGTLCSVFLNDDGTEQEFFVQVSADDTDPVWLSAQDLLLKVYKTKLQDPSFLTDCLKQFTIVSS
jgi:hypothetical protein